GLYCVPCRTRVSLRQALHSLPSRRARSDRSALGTWLFHKAQQTQQAGARGNAEAGCDAFTLARIAGHSSITITQRYCHPQADAIERAFAKLPERVLASQP